MASFSPSENFATRWLSTPMNIRKTIFQELEDIKTLLQSDTPASQFQFNTPKLHESLSQMQAEHEAFIAEQNRITGETINELRHELSAQIEQRIQDNSELFIYELKLWVNQLLDERLAQAQGRR